MQPDIDPSELLPGISDYVFAHARNHPDRPAMRDAYQELDYRSLAAQVNLLALAFQRQGIRRGDRVAVLTTPRADGYAIFLALNAIGAIWLGINPVYQYPEMKYVVSDAEPVALIFLSEFQGRTYREAADQLLDECPCLGKVWCLDQDLDGIDALQTMVMGCVSSDEVLPTELVRDPEDVAMIVYTSGSTGEPKGCMLPNKAMAYRALTQWREFQVTDYPRVYCPLPLNHVGGMQMVAGATLIGGGTVNFQEKFDPATIGGILADGKVNFIVLFPTMYQLILDHPDFRPEDWDSLECINFSGGVISRALLGRLTELGAGRVCTCFGSTETCIGVVFSEPDIDLDVLAISVGKPIRDDVRIVNDDGKLCEVGEIGEFQVRRDYCMAGYFNRPKANAETFTEDGWMKTGDLVEVLPSGDFRFSARKSDMFKSGGYNVYPREIEIVLEQQSSVAAAAVVGVPDDLYGESGYAFLLMVEGQDCDERALREQCKAVLANYKVPKVFHPVDNMPLLPNGKLDKTALKRRARQE